MRQTTHKKPGLSNDKTVKIQMKTVVEMLSALYDGHLAVGISNRFISSTET